MVKPKTTASAKDLNTLLLPAFCLSLEIFGLNNVRELPLGHLEEA